MLALNTLAIGAASLFAVVAANHGQISRAHHHNPLLERSGAHLQKRFGGRATYYAVGLGACGEHNVPSDFIVALNSAQFGGGYPGPNCFKKINICRDSTCRGATIMDECPTCDYGGLDLSEGLFKQFASTDEGIFQMTWSFGDGGNDPEPTTKKPDPPKTTEKPDPPKTTWKPDPPKTTKEPEPEPTTSSKKPKPTTTSTQPETTSTPEPTTTSSTSTSSVPETTSTSTVVSIMTTSTASAPASPSGASGSGSSSGSGASGSNWVDMAQVFLAMGRMATAAHSQQ